VTGASPVPNGDSLLCVENLEATIFTQRETISAVRGISFSIGSGEVVGFVGETGCGKSVTARSLIRLSADAAKVKLAGRITFSSLDLLALSEKEMRDVRGRRIAMIFQDPMTSLSPVLTVGSQIDDILVRHMNLSQKAARVRTVELLDLVGIHDASRRANDHPHEFSGGMRQRVMIAMAISCGPELLIADEPTTALDVSVQAQILRLLAKLRRELGMAIMMIPHDFGVIAGLADRVYVMYDGKIVESGPVEAIFDHPKDPYTRSLMSAVSSLSGNRKWAGAV
jgi:ABC-type dipeptide/oligopeptide/nickel transport system ATPase component